MPGLSEAAMGSTHGPVYESPPHRDRDRHFYPPLCPRGVGSALHVNAIFPTTTLALHIRAPRSHG